MTRATTTKSDSIRQFMAKQPKASAKEIHAGLADKGIQVSMALVTKLKYSKRRRKQGNKAEAIRQAWGEMGADARPRDVIATLADRGIKVTSAQVSTLRNGKTREASFEHLLAARALANQLGSLEAAKSALDSLARLMG